MDGHLVWWISPRAPHIDAVEVVVELGVKASVRRTWRLASVRRTAVAISSDCMASNVSHCVFFSPSSVSWLARLNCRSVISYTCQVARISTGKCRGLWASSIQRGRCQGGTRNTANGRCSNTSLTSGLKMTGSKRGHLAVSLTSLGIG